MQAEYAGASIYRSILACLVLTILGLGIYIYIEREREREHQKPLIFNSRVPGDVIYGHVHMAKTGGTTLNGEMAARFERICGHKGYSYDSWQYNKRVKLNGNGKHWKSIPDSISKVYKGFTRGRVPGGVMVEIGFEDCDYVSHETGWQFWRKTFENWSVPLELHIPCREPISHLMSMCNFKHRKFNCSNDLGVEINKCLLQMGRFSSQLIDSPNIYTRCFSAEQIGSYMEYMGHKLQKKRFSVEYIFRATNAPHHAENECIWSNSSALSFAKRYLGHMEYYKYCASCLGSKRDLLYKW